MALLFFHYETVLWPAPHTNTGMDMPALWPHLASAPAGLRCHKLPERDDPHCLFLPRHTRSHPDPRLSTPRTEHPPSSLPSAPERSLPQELLHAAASKEFPSLPPCKIHPSPAPPDRDTLWDLALLPSLVSPKQQICHSGSESPPCRGRQEKIQWEE